MSFAFLAHFLCCCAVSDDDHDVVDETSRLIPASMDEQEPTTFSNVVLVDHQRLQERLGTIVRAKEGKMVNVNSQIPFNLRNQDLRPELHRSLSRSSSRSLDPPDTPQRDTFNYNPSSTSSPIPGHYLLPYSRPHSPKLSERRTPKHNPILNIRLVSFDDVIEADKHPVVLQTERPTGLGLDLGQEYQARKSEIEDGLSKSGTAVARTSPTLEPLSPLKLQTGAISLSWGD